MLINIFDEVTSSFDEPIVSVAGDGQIQTSNSSFCRLLGKNKHDICGQSFKDLATDSPEKISLYLRSCSRSKNPIPGSVTLLDKTGQEIALRCKGNIIHPGSKGSSPLILLRFDYKQSTSNKFIAINKSLEELLISHNRLRNQAKVLDHEVRERKKSEEKFRKYTEYSPTAIFIVDENGNYKFVNGAAVYQTGYTEKELLKMSIPELVHPDAFEPGVTSFSDLQKKGKVIAEIALKHKDGSRVDVILNAVKLSDTNFLGHTTDITERKRAKVALQRAHNELELRVKERTLELRGGRVSLDRQKRFISDKLPVHIATCF
jgi:PAS domain S-box-containing protein